MTADKILNPDESNAGPRCAMTTGIAYNWPLIRRMKLTTESRPFREMRVADLANREDLERWGNTPDEPIPAFSIDTDHPTVLDEIKNFVRSFIP